MGRRKIIDRNQMLQAISNGMVRQGMAPTIEELRQALGVGSTNTVLRCLRELEEEGYIERWPGARGMKPLKGVEGSLTTRPIPLVGTVSAGALVLAEENLEAWVRLPEAVLTPSTAQFFLLRVRGNSMNMAEVRGGRIEDGDLVLIRQQAYADSGQIVVVVIDGEATVKRLAVGPDYYVLKPESSSRLYQPIVFDREAMIQGIVCRVFKQSSEILDYGDMEWTSAGE